MVVMTGIDISEFIEICNTCKYETFYRHQSVILEFVGECPVMMCGFSKNCFAALLKPSLDVVVFL